MLTNRYGGYNPLSDGTAINPEGKADDILRRGVDLVWLGYAHCMRLENFLDTLNHDTKWCDLSSQLAPYGGMISDKEEVSSLSESQKMVQAFMRNLAGALYDYIERHNLNTDLKTQAKLQKLESVISWLTNEQTVPPKTLTDIYLSTKYDDNRFSVRLTLPFGSAESIPVQVDLSIRDILDIPTQGGQLSCFAETFVDAAKDFITEKDLYHKQVSLFRCRMVYDTITSEQLKLKYRTDREQLERCQEVLIIKNIIRAVEAKSGKELIDYVDILSKFGHHFSNFAILIRVFCVLCIDKLSQHEFSLLISKKNFSTEWLFSLSSAEMQERYIPQEKQQYLYEASQSFQRQREIKAFKWFSVLNTASDENPEKKILQTLNQELVSTIDQLIKLVDNEKFTYDLGLVIEKYFPSSTWHFVTFNTSNLLKANDLEGLMTWNLVLAKQEKSFVAKFIHTLLNFAFLSDITSLDADNFVKKAYQDYREYQRNHVLIRTHEEFVEDARDDKSSAHAIWRRSLLRAFDLRLKYYNFIISSAELLIDNLPDDLSLRYKIGYAVALYLHHLLVSNNYVSSVDSHHSKYSELIALQVRANVVLSQVADKIACENNHYVFIKEELPKRTLVLNPNLDAFQSSFENAIKDKNLKFFIYAYLTHEHHPIHKRDLAKDFIAIADALYDEHFPNYSQAWQALSKGYNAQRILNLYKTYLCSEKNGEKLTRNPVYIACVIKILIFGYSQYEKKFIGEVLYFLSHYSDDLIYFQAAEKCFFEDFFKSLVNSQYLFFKQDIKYLISLKNKLEWMDEDALDALNNLMIKAEQQQALAIANNITTDSPLAISELLGVKLVKKYYDNQVARRIIDMSNILKLIKASELAAYYDIQYDKTDIQSVNMAFNNIIVYFFKAILASNAMPAFVDDQECLDFFQSELVNFIRQGMFGFPRGRLSEEVWCKQENARTEFYIKHGVPDGIIMRIDYSLLSRLLLLLTNIKGGTRGHYIASDFSFDNKYKRGPVGAAVFKVATVLNWFMKDVGLFERVHIPREGGSYVFFDMPVAVANANPVFSNEAYMADVSAAIHAIVTYFLTSEDNDSLVNLPAAVKLVVDTSNISVDVINAARTAVKNVHIQDRWRHRFSLFINNASFACVQDIMIYKDTYEYTLTSGDVVESQDEKIVDKDLLAFLKKLANYRRGYQNPSQPSEDKKTLLDEEQRRVFDQCFYKFIWACVEYAEEHANCNIYADLSSQQFGLDYLIFVGFYLFIEMKESHHSFPDGLKLLSGLAKLAGKMYADYNGDNPQEQRIITEAKKACSAEQFSKLDIDINHAGLILYYNIYLLALLALRAGAIEKSPTFGSLCQSLLQRLHHLLLANEPFREWHRQIFYISHGHDSTLSILVYHKFDFSSSLSAAANEVRDQTGYEEQEINRQEYYWTSCYQQNLLRKSQLDFEAKAIFELVLLASSDQALDFYGVKVNPHHEDKWQYNSVLDQLALIFMAAKNLYGNKTGNAVTSPFEKSLYLIDVINEDEPNTVIRRLLQRACQNFSQAFTNDINSVSGVVFDPRTTMNKAILREIKETIDGVKEITQIYIEQAVKRTELSRGEIEFICWLHRKQQPNILHKTTGLLSTLWNLSMKFFGSSSGGNKMIAYDGRQCKKDSGPEGKFTSIDLLYSKLSASQDADQSVTDTQSSSTPFKSNMWANLQSFEYQVADHRSSSLDKPAGFAR